MLGDLNRRLATELLDKYYNSNSHYMDPSELDDHEESVSVHNCHPHRHILLYSYMSIYMRVTLPAMMEIVSCLIDASASAADGKQIPYCDNL